MRKDCTPDSSALLRSDSLNLITKSDLTVAMTALKGHMPERSGVEGSCLQLTFQQSIRTNNSAHAWAGGQK